MPRIILHNPHIEHYGNSVANFITGKKSIRKYNYLLRYLLKTNEVVIFADSTDSSFSYLPNNLINKKLFLILELYIWCFINKMDPIKYKILTDPKKLDPSDIFLFFSFRNIDKQSHKLDYLKSLKNIKCMHLTHCMHDTSYISNHLKDLGIDFLMAESDLSKTEYFKKHFSFYKKNVYVLPFVYQTRFINNTPFSERIGKCIATGTYSRLRPIQRDEDFRQFFSSDTLHPMRAQIYNNSDKLKGLVDSYIGDWEAETKMTETLKQSRSIIGKFLRLWFVMFKARQKKYFSFDIVKKYNEYQMFINPEELIGLPGVGFIEGMACGCAYIGIDHDMYRDIGLKKNYHYIVYDNTLDGLLDVIRYYQGHQKELEKIAQRGYEYVIDNFSGPMVAKIFYKDMVENATKYRDLHSPGDFNIACSFIKND